MLTALCVLTGVLAPAQPASGSDWVVGPRLARGQELVYSGSYSEEAVGNGVKFARSYHLDTRILALDVAPSVTNLAVLTTLKLRPSRVQAGAEPTSVRLEMARLTPDGKVVLPSGQAPSVPLEGPPTLECGVFVELVRNHAAPGKSWEVAEPERPPRTWQIAGPEMMNGTRCLKVVGVQQSDDWDRPRADRTAWQRRDTLWVVPGLGITCRVDRVIERREPARRDTTQRSMLSYSLESQVVYPPPLYEDRRREIMQYCTLAVAAEPILHEPEKCGRRPIEGIQSRIAYHIDNHPGTPYREAIFQLKRRLDAVGRGDTVPFDSAEEASPVSPVAALGQPAPDFLVSDLITRESLRLRRLLGQPVLMVFYSPASKSCPEVLRFAESLCQANPRGLHVLGLAVGENTERAGKQRDELKLTFPILAGQGLRLTYSVDATPKIVLVDAAGIVRGNYVGWGPETTRIITEELARCFATAPVDSRPGQKVTDKPLANGKMGH